MAISIRILLSPESYKSINVLSKVLCGVPLQGDTEVTGPYFCSKKFPTNIASIPLE